jgi:hypothetical protein
VELPVPEIGVGAGESTDVRHLDHLLVLTVVAPGDLGRGAPDVVAHHGLGRVGCVTVRARGRAEGDRVMTL